MDRSTQALLQDDFPTFRSFFSLPYEIETFKGRRFLESEDDLKGVFEALQAHYRNAGVTDIVQSVVEAMFKDDTTVVSTHETRLLNKTVLTQKPYAVFSVFRNDGTGWRAQSMTFAIEDNLGHNKALMSSRKDKDAPNAK